MSLADQIKQRIKEVPDFPKPGISFKDITPLFLEPSLYPQMIEALAQPFENQSVDYVVGIESRGFLLGPGLAQKLNAGFIMLRKKGKLPRSTRSVSYDLEYGSAELEIHREDIKANGNVLVHDDLLATGGTAAAAAQLIREFNCTLTGFSFIAELNFLNGREALRPHQIHSLVNY